jgi:hypothetical protein
MKKGFLEMNHCFYLTYIQICGMMVTVTHRYQFRR